MSPPRTSPTRTCVLSAVTLGVGHLRRQVSFYGTNLGLRVAAKGRVPAELARQIWQIDDDLDVVTLARQDVPTSLRVRLVRTSDLAARPDFDLTVPGPVGLLYGTRDLQRLYYRLSGAGVEFHAGPSDLAEGSGLRRLYGRAVDGEYVILEEHTAGRGPGLAVSPYFGVTEPVSCKLVVPDLDAATGFLVEALGQRLETEGRSDDALRLAAMGLPEGATLRWRTFTAWSNDHEGDKDRGTEDRGEGVRGEEDEPTAATGDLDDADETTVVGFGDEDGADPDEPTDPTDVDLFDEDDPFEDDDDFDQDEASESGDPSDPGPRLTLLCFDDGQAQTPTVPPARGISSLAFHVDDLDGTLEQARAVGAQLLTPRLEIDHPAFGRAVTATVLPSQLGLLVELWQPVGDDPRG